MTTRRTFIGTLAAIPFIGKIVAPKLNPSKAIPGVTYFRAATPGADVPDDKTITLNGEDIRYCCSEANLVEGWAACYPWGYSPDGALYLLEPPMACNGGWEQTVLADNGERYIARHVMYSPCRLYGRVELVDRMAVTPQSPRKPDGDDIASREILKSLESSMRELSQSVANLRSD